MYVLSSPFSSSSAFSPTPLTAEQDLTPSVPTFLQPANTNDFSSTKVRRSKHLECVAKYRAMQIEALNALEGVIGVVPSKVHESRKIKIMNRAALEIKQLKAENKQLKTQNQDALSSMNQQAKNIEALQLTNQQLNRQLGELQNEKCVLSKRLEAALAETKNQAVARFVLLSRVEELQKEIAASSMKLQTALVGTEILAIEREGLLSRVKELQKEIAASSMELQTALVGKETLAIERKGLLSRVEELQKVIGDSRENVWSHQSNFSDQSDHYGSYDTNSMPQEQFGHVPRL